jgi:hypothetical protein
MARVVAPLTGTVTTGTWVTSQRLNVAAMPHGFINYDYLLPQGYDPAGTTTYPVLVMGHTNTTGSSGSTYPNSVIVTFDLGNGATINGAFNNVAWRTRFPAIVIIPYCDQTDGTGGTGQNFGGYGDSPDSGGNEQGVMALVQSVLANFKADPTRVYATGWSLGGIGSTAWMLDNNLLNGTGTRLFTAGLPISGRIIRTPSPNLTPMKLVPMMCVSGSSDTTSPPEDFNRPAWRFHAGNSTYPSQSSLAASGVAGLKAGASNYYYLEDTTLGHSGAYFTYGVTSAGYPLYDWLFAQISGASTVVTPASILAFLKSIAGTSTISCQFIERGNNTTLGQAAIDTIHTNTGKWLGAIGGDYFFFGQGNRIADTTVNQYAKSYWNAGGLFLLCNHMSHPTSGAGVNDLSFVDAANIVKSGNTTNTNFNAMLDTIIAGVLDLQNAGVITIYRPFHEMNGNWFWWCTQNFSAAQMIAMWIYTHDRFVAKGVTQILWDWSPNAGTAAPNRTSTDTYPGSAYVDIIGHDLYSDNPGIDGKSYYTTLTALASDKPFFINEFGAGAAGKGNTAFDMSTLVNQIDTNMPNTVLWQQWWDGNGGSVGWGMAETTGVKAALSLPRVLNRGDFSLSAAPTFTPSPNGTVILINVAGSIIDSVGNVWTIVTTGLGQVALNTKTDTTTSSVKEMAYVNGVVWHENLSNQWYSWNGSWSGGGTVSPLPNISPNNSFILASGSGSLVDSNFTVWTIAATGGGQVVRGGKTDTTTANVIEMAYVNGVIWHENIVNDWYSLTAAGGWGPPGGTKTSPLTQIPGGLSYILPMKQAGLRVITYIKQESPAAFTTGLASLRAEQAANHDIFAYEGCQEPDTAVLVGTPETLASAATFQQTVWNAGLADGLPVIQTSFGVLADYGTTGNLSATATYGNAHTYPGTLNSTANYAATQTGGFITALTNAALLTTPGKTVAHTEFGWLNTTNNATAVASYVLNFVMSGLFDFNLPYMIVQGLYDDATNGAVGLFNTDQTPRLVATALANMFALLKDTAANALSFGPGKLNISITNLPASPSGSLMGGKFGVLQKSDGSFWVIVRNEQNLTTTVAAGSTPIVVAAVTCGVTLGTIAASIDVYDPLLGTTAQAHFVNTSSFNFSLPAHPVLIKIVRP